MWLEILRQQVGAKGAAQVATELGLSRTTLSLVASGKYGASTKRIEERVAAIYGNNGSVACGMLGEISPSRCAENYNRAKNIGMRAGNPETLRLYKTCLKCPVRRG